VNDLKKRIGMELFNDFSGKLPVYIYKDNKLVNDIYLFGNDQTLFYRVENKTTVNYDIYFLPTGQLEIKIERERILTVNELKKEIKTIIKKPVEIYDKKKSSELDMYVPYENNQILDGGNVYFTITESQWEGILNKELKIELKVSVFIFAFNFFFLLLFKLIIFRILNLKDPE
jgi:hypothetical protein